MSRIAYVNGAYVPLRDARVHVEDRGYQFADGVYEVCEVRGGRLVDEAAHMDRLERSLGALRMGWPLSRQALSAVLRETIRRNRLKNGIVYFQITRGVAPRDHPFPPASTRPSLVVTARPINPAKAKRAETGMGVITLPDERWARRDIKSVSLLPNILAKQTARDAGAGEAWLVDGQGFVTEGSSTNAWIVTGDGTLVTRPLSHDILPGITRALVLDVIRAEGLPFEERAFSVEEARNAREAFVTASSAVIVPVTAIDGHPVGNGEPGLLTMRLRAAAIARSPISSEHLPRN